MDAAARICSRLLQDRSVERSALPDLEVFETRVEVERRLLAVGVALAPGPVPELLEIRFLPDLPEEALGDLERIILETLRRHGGVAAMGELARATSTTAFRLRKVLKALEEAGHVRRTGQRSSARYHLR